MGFNNELDNNDEVMSEINMTPLVDVMLVLLIIFIIAMPLLNQAIKIDLPKADNQTTSISPETITLSVNESGKLYWNKQAISQAVLQQKLQAVAQQQPQPEIHLRGDRHVEYAYIVRVMTAVRHAGIEKLGFITEPMANNKK
ncbi:MAG: biopolymer transporter ExbD [Gammaproteobacteria bacterium]|nr:biopolymer transporter ExbD [Gammaproteobacteria bacterium]